MNFRYNAFRLLFAQPFQRVGAFYATVGFAGTLFRKEEKGVRLSWDWALVFGALGYAVGAYPFYSAGAAGIAYGAERLTRQPPRLA